MYRVVHLEWAILVCPILVSLLPLPASTERQLRMERVVPFSGLDDEPRAA